MTGCSARGWPPHCQAKPDKPQSRRNQIQSDKKALGQAQIARYHSQEGRARVQAEHAQSDPHQQDS